MLFRSHAPVELLPISGIKLSLQHQLNHLHYNQMEKGVVKFFNETKGFGFIKMEGSEKDIFVHVTGLKDKIRENDSVEFELQEGKKGLNAVNVRLA